MKMRRQLIGLVCFGLLLAGAKAEAFDWFGGRLSIGGGYGRAKPEFPSSYKDQYQDGEMWSANMKYFLNNDFSVVASYADLEPYRRGDKNDNYRFRPVIASLRYNLFHHLPITPYLTAGAGYAFNKHEVPGLVADKWNGFTWQGGVGLEFFVTEGTSLGAEGLYHSFEGNGNAKPYQLVSALGTVNLYFGPGPSQRRTEEALKRQQAETEKARQEAEAAKAQALANQNAAQQQLTQAEKDAAAAREQADLMKQQAQAAQAEIDQIKQMVATKQFNPITFKSGSSDLLVASDPTLDKVAAVAKKYPNLKLRVEGHTDSTGSSDKNQTLSQERADVVKTYLTQTDGIPADQITAVGFGQSHPVASNTTAEGRAQNRRVEFIFFLK